MRYFAGIGFALMIGLALTVVGHVQAASRSHIQNDCGNIPDCFYSVTACRDGRVDLQVRATWLITTPHPASFGPDGVYAGQALYYAGSNAEPVGKMRWDYRGSVVNAGINPNAAPRPAGTQSMEFVQATEIAAPCNGPINRIEWQVSKTQTDNNGIFAGGRMALPARLKERGRKDGGTAQSNRKP